MTARIAPTVPTWRDAWQIRRTRAIAQARSLLSRWKANCLVWQIRFPDWCVDLIGTRLASVTRITADSGSSRLPLNALSFKGWDFSRANVESVPRKPAVWAALVRVSSAELCGRQQSRCVPSGLAIGGRSGRGIGSRHGGCGEGQIRLRRTRSYHEESIEATSVGSETFRLAARAQAFGHDGHSRSNAPGTSPPGPRRV